MTVYLLRRGFWYQNGDVKPNIDQRSEIALAALLYLFVAAVTFWICPVPPAPIWLATGFAISYLKLRGARFWPIAALAATAALGLHLPLYSSLLIGLALAGEAALGVWLLAFTLNAFRGTHHRNILAYGMTAILAPVVSATVATHILNGSETFFLQWWFGDTVGILILAPLLCKPWERDAHDTASPLLRLAIHGFGLAIGFALLFFQHRIPSLYLLFPVILIAGEFLSGRDVRVQTFTFALLAIFSASYHLGPLPLGVPGMTGLALPLFLISLGMTSLAITAFRRAGSLRLPGVTLILFWLLGYSATTVVEYASERQDRQQLEKGAEMAADQIADHIRAHEATLRGGAGLFNTLKNITTSDWKKYYRSLHLPDMVSGLQSISAIFPVKKNGKMEYRVRFVEPAKVRRLALDESRKSYRTAVSRRGPMLISQTRTGFTIYTPVKDGWIEGSFDGEVFFKNALKNSGSEFDIFVFDSPSDEGGRLFYSSSRQDYSSKPDDVRRAVGENSQKFHIYVRPSAAFVVNHNSVSWVTFVAAMVALLGAALTCSVTARAQEIKASENRIMAVVDQSPFSTLLFTPDGKVRKFNRAYLNLWNVTPEEAERVLPNYNILHDPVLKETGITPLIERAVAGEAVSIPPTFYDPSDNQYPGRARWIEAYLTPIFSLQGTVNEISLTLIDVTDMIEARELIQQKQLQMQAIQVREKSAIEASRLKSEFLANMSHEIRTPINGIVGMARLLSESPLDEEQKSFAKAIVKSSDHLLALVNDILDISKVEAGRIEFEMLPFNLSELITNVRASFEPLIAKKGLGFNVTMSFDDGQCFIGDPSRIQQILNNLISNAVKFTSDGEIGLDVSVHHDGDGAAELTFQVSDTGIGISEDLQKLIFKPFVQGDSSTARRFGGTGLGLAISKRLTEHMRGQLLVESQEEFGSTFTFKIRLKAASAEDVARIQVREPVKAHHEDRAKARILIAEDNAINSEILQRVLSKAGYRADAVANGLEVLSAIHDIRYDMILMDCQMPEMDGYEATRQLRSRGYTLPVIAITAHALKDDAEKCMAAGMSDFLSKPVPEDRLIQTVDKWLQAGTGDILQANVLLGLENLERDGGAGLIRRLVTMYGETMRRGIDELRQNLYAPTTELAKLAHSLKSANANLGAWIPANVLQTIEDEKPTGDSLLKRIDELEIAFLDAERALIEYLRKQEAHGPNPMC